MKKYTLDDFIRKAREVHGDKYDYSKVVYVNGRTKVCIICPIHGEFWVVPIAHLAGNGCKLCYYESRIGKYSLKQEEVIQNAKKVHGDKYDYSKAEYKNNRTKFCVICPIHGEFWITPNHHISNKRGCPMCGRKMPTVKDLIERFNEVHNGKYDYSNVVDYKNTYEKVHIICKKCSHDFWQTPCGHLHGRGCPKCKQSKLEDSVERFLQSNSIEYIPQKTFDWLKFNNNMLLDFYLPEYNIAIECQGEQHFFPVDFNSRGEEETVKAFELIKERDRLKKQLCEEHGVKMLYYSNLDIECPYDVFTDLDKLLLEII